MECDIVTRLHRCGVATILILGVCHKQRRTVLKFETSRVMTTAGKHVKTKLLSELGIGRDLVNQYTFHSICDRSSLSTRIQHGHGLSHTSKPRRTYILLSTLASLYNFFSARNASTETDNVRNDVQLPQPRSPNHWQQSSCRAITYEIFSTILCFFFLRCYNIFARYVLSSISTE